MSDYSSKTRGEMIVTSQWAEFFADLTQSHQGRPVAIQIGGSLPLGDLPEERPPFQGMEYHADHRPKTIVFTIGQGTATETRTVEEPSLVWRARDEQGEVMIVKISDSMSRTVFLHF